MTVTWRGSIDWTVNAPTWPPSTTMVALPPWEPTKRARRLGPSISIPVIRGSGSADDAAAAGLATFGGRRVWLNNGLVSSVSRVAATLTPGTADWAALRGPVAVAMLAGGAGSAVSVADGRNSKAITAVRQAATSATIEKRAFTAAVPVGPDLT